MEQEAIRVRAKIEDGLRRHKTDVDLNKRDTLGDGDQSPIKHENHDFKQFYRDLFAEGGDIGEQFQFGLLSRFALSCIYGDVKTVKTMLEEASAADDTTPPGQPPATLVKLLETRETAMRLSPLMMIVSAGKNLAVLPGTVSQFSSNQIHVARLLLSYGARPDAKDVCGKTVCHYGAGAMATDMTMQVVQMASEAYKSGHLWCQEVQLMGLEKAPHLNGKTGIARGYQVDSGRRTVFMLHDDSMIAVKPQNLRLVSETKTSTSDQQRVDKLCNIQCRLGMTSLQETIMSSRDDVATFLLDKLDASVDIADYDGISPAMMATSGGVIAELMSPAAAVVKRAMTERGKVQARAERRKCANCKKPEEGEHFNKCSKCMVARYCSRDCQVEHWKNGHKKECKKLEAGNLGNGIKLEKPDSDGMFTAVFSRQGAGPTGRNQDGYRKPTGVAFDEPFYVKVQGGGPQMPLMVYDETRECSFCLHPGKPGFKEMRAKVNAEPTFQGRKTYMKASFNAKGECTVYPSTAKLQRCGLDQGHEHQEPATQKYHQHQQHQQRPLSMTATLNQGGGNRHKASSKSTTATVNTSGAGTVVKNDGSNSFLKQYTDRSNEIEALKARKEKIQKELEGFTESRTSLQKLYGKLIEENRDIKSMLGEKTTQLNMLKDKRSRLTNMLELESRALQDCAGHTKTLMKRERATKDKHNVDLETCNNDIETVLRRQFQKKMLKYISVRTVRHIILPLYINKIDSSMMMADGAVATSGADASGGGVDPGYRRNTAPATSVLMDDLIGKLRHGAEELAGVSLSRRQAVRRYRKIRTVLMLHGISHREDKTDGRDINDGKDRRDGDRVSIGTIATYGCNDNVRSGGKGCTGRDTVDNQEGIGRTTTTTMMTKTTQVNNNSDHGFMEKMMAVKTVSGSAPEAPGEVSVTLFYGQ